MTHDFNNFTTYRSLLCLDGDLPPSSFFLKLQLPLIAADGAANTLLERGIVPDLIIGDLDSVHENILKQHPFLHLPDQNRGDYQKSLDYLHKNNLLPAVVLGVNGGLLDHVLNNINVFIETDCLLYAPPLKGFVVHTASIFHLNVPYNTKISLLGIPHASLSSQGLKWDLDKTALSFPGKSSCFNRSQSSTVTINLHRGTVLVLIYENEINDAGLS